MAKAIKIDGRIKFLHQVRTINGTTGIQYATNKQLYDWGFREVITPTITVYQTLGSIYYEEYIIDSSGNTTGNYFTYEVVDWTQEQIDEYDQNVIDSDTQSGLEIKHLVDGEKYFRRIKSTIRRNRDSGKITPSQALGFKRNLAPVIRPLREGDWDLAKENLDAMDTPNDQDVLEVLSGITGTVVTYINNEYID